MKHINITEELLDKARARIADEAEEMGDLRGSIENGDGNFAGLFGELLFVETIGGSRENTYNYDVVYDGYTIDVKTKRRSVKPKGYYECSIADFNTSQDCDVYYFVSVLYDYSEAWMLGYKRTDEYYDEAVFHEEGDVDPDNGFTFKADCWNLPIYNLDSIENI